jgi:hypothetical protein
VRKVASGVRNFFRASQVKISIAHTDLAALHYSGLPGDPSYHDRLEQEDDTIGWKLSEVLLQPAHFPTRPLRSLVEDRLSLRFFWGMVGDVLQVRVNIPEPSSNLTIRP